MPEPTLIPAGNVTQEELDAAGISANIALSFGVRMIAVPPDTSEEDLAKIEALIAGELIVEVDSPELPSDERGQLTAAWLTAKACLDAIPPAPSSGDVDPYALTRARMAAQVEAARAAMDAAGGPA